MLGSGSGSCLRGRNIDRKGRAVRAPATALCLHDFLCFPTASSTALLLPASLSHNSATYGCPLPAVCGIVLLADNIYRAGQLLWGVARSALPPRAQRTADVAFWLGFAAITTWPLWS